MEEIKIWTQSTTIPIDLQKHSIIVEICDPVTSRRGAKGLNIQPRLNSLAVKNLRDPRIQLFPFRSRNRPHKRHIQHDSSTVWQNVHRDVEANSSATTEHENSNMTLEKQNMTPTFQQVDRIPKESGHPCMQRRRSSPVRMDSLWSNSTNASVFCFTSSVRFERQFMIEWTTRLGKDEGPIPHCQITLQKSGG